MTEPENRLYAINLMNRAGINFTAQDIALLAQVIPLLEDDVRALLIRDADQVKTLASVGDIAAARRANTLLGAAVRVTEGRHRPPIHPPSASRETNAEWIGPATTEGTAND